MIYAVYAAAFVASAFLIGFAACKIMKKKHEKQMGNIESQLESFLGGDETNTAFSVEDNSYATLKNYISELEERLIRQKEMLIKKSNETAGFIADISHQLKTPLAGIKLYCEMDSAPHREKQLALIEHMEHHIKSLLRLEKLRVDAYKLEFKRHDIRGIIENSWDKLQPVFGNVTLTVNGSEELRCDGYWLGEAFLNILKNSCEYMKDAGEITVSIFAEQSSVFVEIEDTGGGIQDSELERIFTRFRRINRAGKTDGAGLGLAITKAIVEKHHGTVIASNTAAGLKTTFCFPVISGHLTIM
jgi:signal transduction histidine kinase